MGLFDNAFTGIAGSAIGAIGNVVGGLMQGHAQRQANRANMELAKYSYDQNLQQWNRENEYNSPFAQMQRYKAAGLNPNLIYSQQNTAGNSPQMSAPQVAPVTGPAQGITNAFNQMSQFASAVFALKRQQAEIAKIEADTQDVQYRNALTNYFWLDEIDYRRKNYDFKTYLMDYQQKQNALEYNYRQAKLGYDTQLLPYQFDFQKEKLLTDFFNYNPLVTARLRSLNSSSAVNEQRAKQMNLQYGYLDKYYQLQNDALQKLVDLRDNQGHHTWRGMGLDGKFGKFTLGGIVDGAYDLYNFFKNNF